MFENYFNNSIPDNINYCDTNLNCNYDLPCETPSENDGISSYYWYYGDTVNLEFDITGEIRVETNAIVYSITGASPTSITYGTIGRKAYNIIDLISWTLVAISGTDFTWKQDDEFTYPETGGIPVYLSAEEFLHNKLVEIDIYNFRFEKVFSKTLNASSKVVLSIDKELSSKFLKGTYYVTLTAIDEIGEELIPIFKKGDCTLLVK